MITPQENAKHLPIGGPDTKRPKEKQCGLLPTVSHECSHHPSHCAAAAATSFDDIRLQLLQPFNTH